MMDTVGGRKIAEKDELLIFIVIRAIFVDVVLS